MLLQNHIEYGLLWLMSYIFCIGCLYHNPGRIIRPGRILALTFSAIQRLHIFLGFTYAVFKEQLIP
jgi:hypothetical protein